MVQDNMPRITVQRPAPYVSVATVVKVMGRDE
jgi:hypothetical protein